MYARRPVAVRPVWRAMMPPHARTAGPQRCLLDAAWRSDLVASGADMSRPTLPGGDGGGERLVGDDLQLRRGLSASRPAAVVFWRWFTCSSLLPVPDEAPARRSVKRYALWTRPTMRACLVAFGQGVVESSCAIRLKRPRRAWNAPHTPASVSISCSATRAAPGVVDDSIAAPIRAYRSSIRPGRSDAVVDAQLDLLAPSRRRRR